MHKDIYIIMGYKSDFCALKFLQSVHLCYNLNFDNSVFSVEPQVVFRDNQVGQLNAQTL